MPANFSLKNQTCFIVGEINFETAPFLWQESLPVLETETLLQFDFSKVTATNSAGLALMFAWMKYARGKGKKIVFSNLPSGILAMAGVGGVLSLLLKN